MNMYNHVDGVMVSVFPSSVVYLGFKFSSVKPKTIKLVFAASPICMQH